MSKNKGYNGLVYSTNPNWQPESNEEEIQTSEPSKQVLIVSIDKKFRGGKLVTLVRGFQGKEEDLEVLGKTLKTKCGTGGSVKDGEIIIQGDHKQKVIDWLRQQGYKVK